MSRAKDVVETIARALVDYPEAVSVTETERREDIYIEVRTADGDLGKMIGRQGRTAAAVRALANVTTEMVGQRAMVDFVDDVE
jgi:predicted RNA-binding protein YlqC (UPF0109 family)